MSRIRLSIMPRMEHDQPPLDLDALDIATALTVADINTISGQAELWDGERRIARLIRHGEAGAPFWQVGG
ncbi:hypothetical protein [Erythrobacter mangrovi]|uniref:Uncharacterized protein n=1 Tax=Erythrobacter mangrovi TaxID=2739433 RepID=A0A7D4BB89_9SPHN|nr:hypothetical protein [Erythrobacter mangrovi]QKG72021.1 hypothetical protein HQR01_11960 [Erythrobacter mangrovi]